MPVRGIIRVIPFGTKKERQARNDCDRMVVDKNPSKIFTSSLGPIVILVINLLPLVLLSGALHIIENVNSGRPYSESRAWSQLFLMAPFYGYYTLFGVVHVGLGVWSVITSMKILRERGASPARLGLFVGCVVVTGAYCYPVAVTTIDCAQSIVFEVERQKTERNKNNQQSK